MVLWSVVNTWKKKCLITKIVNLSRQKLGSGSDQKSNFQLGPMDFQMHTADFSEANRLCGLKLFWDGTTFFLDNSSYSSTGQQRIQVFKMVGDMEKFGKHLTGSLYPNLVS